MADEIENKETDLDEDHAAIGDIEGLERDLPQDDSSSQKTNEYNNNINTPDEIEPLEILNGGKLKSAESADAADESMQDEEKPSLKTKLKESKTIRILLIALALLILLIVVFIFTSSSEPQEQTVENNSKPVELTPLETYVFKIDHINVPRLNKQLESLTKYELLGMTEEEYLKEEKLKALRLEKEEEELKLRLEKEAQEKVALELAHKEALEQEEKNKAAQEVVEQENKENVREETIATNTETSATQENANQEETKKPITQEEKSANTFLKFIQINTNKKAIYKSYLHELKQLDTRIHACRNINNIIEVFIGPLNKDEDITILIQAIKDKKLSKDAIEIELTKEEFATRCMVFEEE
ncbi:MAG: hypothetical protein WC141_02200 [Arcobacteraceae bacterium]